MAFTWTIQTLVLSTVLVSSMAQDCPLGCQCMPGQPVMTCEDLDQLPQIFPAGITDFIFKGCRFTGELGPFPESYSGATQLHIMSSQVETLAVGAFKNVPNLTHLNLRGNKLEYIDSAALEGLSQLLYISLEGNHLAEIEDDLFKFNPELETVLVGHNHGLQLNRRSFAQPDDSDRKSKITHLDLTMIGLNRVPTATICHSKVPELQHLVLSMNDLRNLTAEDRSFKHAPNLHTLELDRSQIMRVNRETFGAMKMLKSLILSNNYISHIDEFAFDDFYATLENLHLEYNQLAQVPYGLFNWNQLKLLNISHNPWECSCANRWMQEFPVSSNNTNFHIMCASPEEYKDQNALKVMKDELDTCSEPTSDSMVAVYVAIPILVILAIITIIIIVKICKLKSREKHGGTNTQYSLVYKPTTEKA